MTCPTCGKFNHCPACNGWICEGCGSDLPAVKADLERIENLKGG